MWTLRPSSTPQARSSPVTTPTRVLQARPSSLNSPTSARQTVTTRHGPATRSGIPTTFAGANKQQYCNHDLDEANGQYNAASSDQEIADASAHAQQILANDVVSIPLVERC